ncbi:hypothetical protein SAMN04490244_10773 [Tranquillimonas rosea]|uniref:Uncharacterized protein n=1 Tax=Tranquillimonas rosea TaxID=641238 RepID=A0A1H9VFJ1_9RHOB|nr:hypothetical protein [Tranquillimonas rosea]SES20348.1 hypothetical protein SAMN04490244_10773 [Tranquillimonas rosea]
MMGRVFKLLLVLLVAAFVGLAGFAYLGNLSPEQVRIEAPVILDAQ